MTRRSLLAAAIVVWIGILAVAGKTSIDRLSVPQWGNPIGDSLSPAVAGDLLVGQQFTALLPGLYRIDLTFDRTTTSSDRELIFHLKSDPAAPSDLWTSRLAAGDLEADGTYAFEFEPLRDSKGQSYYFCVESPTSAPGDAIAVRYGPDAVLDAASAYLDGQPVSGDLQFQTFYALRTREKLDLLLSRMAEGRPYLLGTKGFYVGLAVVYGLVLGIFLLQIARSILQERDEEP
jgi:hypothetical protein